MIWGLLGIPLLVGGIYLITTRQRYAVLVGLLALYQFGVLTLVGLGEP